MVDRQKTIGETIDTDGCFQTIHSMAMVALKNGSDHSPKNPALGD